MAKMVNPAENRPVSTLQHRVERLDRLVEMVRAEKKLMRQSPEERRTLILAMVAREYPLLTDRKHKEYVRAVELILAHE